MTDEEIEKYAAELSTITFMIDRSGNLQASTLMPGVNPREELKDIAKLFVALHTGQLININAKNILMYCQSLGLAGEALKTIEGINKKLNKLNSQPLIKPSEVLSGHLMAGK